MLLLLLKPKAEKDRNCLSVYQFAFFLFFLYADMTMTHTVRTGDLGAYMIGKKMLDEFSFLICSSNYSLLVLLENKRTSKRSIHKGISLVSIWMALMSMRVTHRISMTCFSYMFQSHTYIHRHTMRCGICVYAH